ncbi:MAG TPA: lysophospholipid acyltransferase family protein [Usitatibacter sp.]|nr:lysophospholipid acyltransferase family protein [Usitatibacter sp.]
MASSTASEIWSETLSGWPSETDSDVNRNSFFIAGNPSVAQARHFSKRLKLLFRLLARLPLAANHALGAFAGRLVYFLSPRYRRRLVENLQNSDLVPAPEYVRRFAQENAAEIGKGATELAWALFRADEVVGLVRECIGWEAVEALRRANQPILFVTPHLGAYDVAGRYLWSRLPILAMYRPHKIFWIDQLLREGRNRGAAPDGTNVAPANMAGVRMVLKHLRRGGSTVVLPDQVPGLGEGEWADFFGRPAYTMTLLGRLQEASGAAIVFCYAERLPRAGGFRLHLDPLLEPLPTDRRAAARCVNAAVEKLIRSCPAQYLWGYNRYKRPAGAPPPPA